MGTVTRIGKSDVEQDPRHTPLLQLTAIWARTVLRGWRTGLHDLYSRIP